LNFIAADTAMDRNENPVEPLLDRRKKRIRDEIKRLLAEQRCRFDDSGEGEYARFQRETGHKIGERLFSLERIVAARTVMTYLSFGTELPTFPFLFDLFSRETPVLRTVLIPWCDGSELRLFRLNPVRSRAATFYEASDELKLGAYGIPEPELSLRRLEERTAAPTEPDVILVPGLAFDRKGNRLGRGAGYYDRFLGQVSEQTLLVGLCYEEQLIDSVPVTDFDHPVSVVVTPERILMTGK